MAQNYYTVDDLSRMNPDDSLYSYIFDTITDVVHRGSGKGGYFNRYQQVMSRFDRFGHNALTTNHENVGLFFITKPKLNLCTTSIRQNNILATLDTLDNTSYPFAIRCYLDSKFSRDGVARNIAKLCPWFDSDSPFINPLCNNLLQIHGHPSFDVQTQTTTDGFFSENQTIAIGSDFLNQTYDLSLTFRDIQGGVIMAILYYWVLWIALMTRGDVIRYMEDILAKRLSYTCSIYRFVLDPTKQYITSWSKATGCFPTSIPLGEKFDITSREHFISALQDFSVPFKANHIEYMNPNTFRSFNTIVREYAGDIYEKDGVTFKNGRVPLNNSAENNYKGIPYIATEGGFNRLLWLGDQDEVGNTLSKSLTDLRAKIDQRMELYNRMAAQQQVNQTDAKNLDVDSFMNLGKTPTPYSDALNNSYVIPTSDTVVRNPNDDISKKSVEPPLDPASALASSLP